MIGLCAAPAPAIIVFEKGRSQPIRGYLVSEDDTQVTVKEVLPGGGTRQRSLPRSAIEDVIIALDTKRLASLRPETPTAYRDYAEELREKREDPEARETAIRLYLIAASLEPAELGRSCLLGMTDLARSPEEERRFRAMAFLLDRAHDRALLKSPSAASRPSLGLTDSERAVLRRLLRLLRTRQTSEARSIMSQSTVRDALPKVTPWLPQAELAEAAAEDSILSPGLLRKILQLELLLSGRPVAAADPDKAETWSRILARGSTDPIVPLTLETLTEFDPGKCCYRNGQWEKPVSKPAS